MSQFLLVHGLGLSSRIWSELTPILTCHGRVVAVDLPGHGDAVSGAVDWADLWEKISYEISEIDWPDTTIVLHSFAASILPEFLASRFRSKKIVVVEGIVYAENDSWSERLLSLNNAEYERWITRFRLAADNALRTQLVTRPPAKKIAYWSDAFRAVDQVVLYRYAHDLQQRLRRGDVLKAIKAIVDGGVPISYVFGGRTRLAKTRVALRNLGAVKIYEVASAGHFPMIDAPKELASIIVASESAQY